MVGRTFDPRQYWDRRLETTWSFQGVGLKNVSKAYNRWLYRVRSRVFTRAVRRLDIDPRGARVLDIGPGVGFYVTRWLSLGADVTGADIADSAVRRLADRFPAARFVQLDIGAPDPPLEGGFDVIDAFDVLFHLPDDDQHARALRNVHDLLRPGGWFVFTDMFATKRSTPSAHYVRRSRTEIERAVHDAGLRIVSREPAFVLMNYPFDGHRLHRKLWLKVLAPMQHRERPGGLLGALLYLPELLLTRLRRESPTTELMICRRPIDAHASGR
jgi:SAM-dependent methyltransferase